MKNIFEINLSYYTKEGKINVEFDELKKLFKVIEDYHQFMRDNIEKMDDNEKNEFYKNIRFIEYMINKYLILPDLSQEQKKWYSLLQKCNNPEITRNMKPDDAENMRREAWGGYLVAKKEREDLKSELEKIRKKEREDLKSELEKIRKKENY